VHGIEALQHLRRDRAGDHGLLQWVTVDQHGRRQGLEGLDAEGVEDSRSDPPQVRLTGGDIAHDPLFEVRLEVAPPLDILDPELAAGQIVDTPDEIGHGRLERRILVPIGQPQHHRLAFPARLAAGARASRSDGRDDEKQRDHPTALRVHPVPSPVHRATPLPSHLSHLFTVEVTHRSAPTSPRLCRGSAVG
jgi:hypothetical protein